MNRDYRLRHQLEPVGRQTFLADKLRAAGAPARFVRAVSSIENAASSSPYEVDGLRDGFGSGTLRHGAAGVGPRVFGNVIPPDYKKELEEALYATLRQWLQEHGAEFQELIREYLKPINDLIKATLPQGSEGLFGMFAVSPEQVLGLQHRKQYVPPRLLAGAGTVTPVLGGQEVVIEAEKPPDPMLVRQAAVAPGQPFAWEGVDDALLKNAAALRTRKVIQRGKHNSSEQFTWYYDFEDTIEFVSVVSPQGSDSADATTAATNLPPDSQAQSGATGEVAAFGRSGRSDAIAQHQQNPGFLARADAFVAGLILPLLEEGARLSAIGMEVISEFGDRLIDGTISNARRFGRFRAGLEHDVFIGSLPEWVQQGAGAPTRNDYSLMGGMLATVPVRATVPFAPASYEDGAYSDEEIVAGRRVAGDGLVPLIAAGEFTIAASAAALDGLQAVKGLGAAVRAIDEAGDVWSAAGRPLVRMAGDPARGSGNRGGSGGGGGGGGGWIPGGDGDFVVLEHGTTMQRARSILRNGPDPNFVEPGGAHVPPAEGFSTAPPEGPFPYGSPDDYAFRKDALFPTEGGPAVVRVRVPRSIADRAIPNPGDIRFESGEGLEELLQAWPGLDTSIRIPDGGG